MKTKIKDGWVQIPAIGMVPAFRLDIENKAQVQSLIRRADAYFSLSKQAWEMANTGRKTSEQVAALSARECKQAENGAALLEPLGIVCDWPGLWPTFKVGRFTEYSIESAVLAAIGKPMNWLR